MTHDVAIVGAGPVGATLALALAGADLDVAQAECLRCLQSQRQHFGIRCRAIEPPERFDAGLQELACAALSLIHI